jgi:predicted nucleotidyltransferase
VKSTACSTTLEQLLGSRVRAKLLGWLLSHPGERYFVRQLGGILQEDSTNLSRELARLEASGIVTATREGQQKYFRANQESSIYPELRGLVIKTAGLGEVLRQALTPLADRISLAFVFGSVAAGKETTLSDVDLLVVGDLSLREIMAALGPDQDRLGREINPTVYSIAELRERIARGHHFLRTVLEGPKIFLIGDSHELERLAAERVAV